MRKLSIFLSVIFYLGLTGPIVANNDIDSLREVIAMCEPSRAKIGSILRLIPKLGYSTNECDSLLEEGKKIAKDLNLKYAYSDLLYYDAVASHIKRDFESCKSKIDEILMIISGDESRLYDIVKTKDLKLKVLKSEGNYSEAISHGISFDGFLDSIITYHVPDTVDTNIVIEDYIAYQGDVAGQIAEIYNEIEEPELAIKYFEQAISLFDDLGDLKSKSVYLTNFANLYTSQGKHEKARSLLLESREIAIHLKRSLSILISDLNLIENAINLNRYSEAEEYLSRNRDVIQKYNDPELSAFFLWQEGRLALKSGENKKGLEKLEAAEVLRRDHEILDDMDDFLVDLSSAYQANNNFKQALAVKDEYIEVLKSKSDQNFIKRIAIKEAEWDYQKKLADIEKNKVLSEERDKARINRMSLVRNTLILGLLGAVISSFLIYKNYTEKRKDANMLAENKKQLEKNLNEKEILLKEIHHRVKNNLQVVSSLLSLQTEYVKDDKALEAILDGQNRVNSMSLIHQNLYQEDNLTGVNTTAYFSKLLTELVRTYNISQDNIDLKINISDLVLDVDTMVPLGLIANELVTNAIKYGTTYNSLKLNVELKKLDEIIELTVQDSGPGFDYNSEFNKTCFGYRLINAFCNKLNGKLSIDTNNGTSVKISFNENEVQ